jgi:CBS domain-containing protein/RNA polymerase-binding transcription factor DksA
MSRDPVCLEPGAAVAEALDLIVDEGVSHLPVVDAKRRVVGIVSIHDLAAALPIPVSAHRAPEDLARHAVHARWVGELMSYAPDTVSADTLATDAARRMAIKGIGCLPVVDAEGRLEGILSETDVLQAFAAGAGKGGEESTASASSDEDRFVGELRGEQETLSRDLALHNQVGPELAAIRLQAVQDAIARAERGELRTCVRCSGTISINRLRALPGTTLCGRCARDAEW